MATGICSKCGATCSIIFRPYFTKNGKIIRSRSGKMFPIPVCGCTSRTV